VLFLFGVVGSVAGDAAAAEPAAITQAKREAQALQELIDDLEDQLDAAIEEYNYATSMLEETKGEAEQTQALLTQAEEDLARVDSQLCDRIVAIYKEGQLGLVEVLLEAESVSSFVERLNMVERLSAQDAELVTEVKAYRDEKSERSAELAVQIERQTAYASEVEAARAKVQVRLTANARALAGKESQIAQLVKAEAERQARLAAAAKKAAEAAARKARLAAEAKAKARAAAAAAAHSKPVSVPASASTSDVVNIALKYLGCKYVWAAAGPNTFDCSGLVLYVYKQVGVNLPHSSRMQRECGVAVARADLQPGDLIFFYNPIHHVAIYIGGGKMVHAAGVGKGVRIDVVPTRNYNSACRIIR
jgi:cell wall-associated NlpC family hydrolase